MRTLIVILILALPAVAQVPPEKALATMKAADGLQVELFASEPMVINPTNMDIDPLGRVWITEAVNYRTQMRKKPLNREDGDRIVILTDTKGVGKADEMTVFYQGTELYGPLGICIIPFPNKDAKNGMGFRVLVSQSPDILEFMDKDGDGKADSPPTKFLSGFKGVDHDHGVHAIQVGPDGKFYFTVGDQGVKDLQSTDGKGRKWTSNDTDCRAGTIWRCDPDGKNLELIAHNFRNHYEVTVDSFGEIWASDNDDDGNQQTRICYVMPGGNYGYHPRGPGQSHWHQEQPGIVPNVLRTGFGSPCGILTYEGTLLPEKYRGQLIHADAGPREIRAFHKKPKGAGYELEKSLMLTSTDNWYRPSDVCVAPDGSVFVCDWYDPGVGGHGMGDTMRGRVYRITPAGHKGYQIPGVKETDAGSILNSIRSGCNTSTHLGTQIYAAALKEGVNSDKSGLMIESLKKAMPEKFDPVLRARIAWVTHKLKTDTNEAPLAAVFPHERTDFVCRVYSDNSNFTDNNFFNTLRPDYFKEWHINACRQLLIEFRTHPVEQLRKCFWDLASRYDGQDRFFLAALNIACGTDPERREKILADFDKHFPEWNDKVADLVWELQPKVMLAKMDGYLKDPKLTPVQKARIVDILAASSDVSAGKTMLALLTADHPAEVKTRAIDFLKLFLPTKWKALAGGGELKKAIESLMKTPATRVTGLQLVAAVRAEEQLKEVIRLTDVNGGGTEPITSDVQLEAIRTLGRLRNAEVIPVLVEHALKEAALQASPYAMEAIRSLGHLIEAQAKDDVSQKALKALEDVVTSTKTTAYVPRKLVAVEELSGSSNGANWLVKLKEQDKFPKELVTPAGMLLRNSPHRGVQEKAVALFPPSKAKLDLSLLPSNAALAKRTGNAVDGKKVFLASFKGEAQCMKCHTVHKEGGAIGPDLSAIGKKASRENLFESILQPSKAIADQFVTWKLETDDGQSISGLLVKETPTTLTLRDANGKDYELPVKGTQKKKLATSLMPDDIAKTLTEQELIDLVEYMFSLKE
ncbi:hypothetical protein BH11PLA2_BH11PLA2_47370 [soil metagenome]